MKKIYTLIATVAVVFSANAQRTVSTSTTPASNQAFGTVNAERAPFDTLWWANAASSPTLYSATGGGYVAGNNGYGDLQKAQAFTNSFGPVAVTGTLIWWGAKKGAGAGTSKVQVREYSLNGTGTCVAGSSCPAPGTVNRTLDVLHSAIDTTAAGSIMAHTFATPVMTSVDFAVGVNLATLAAGDTVGIVTNADGDAGATDMAWEQWSDNSWHSFLEPMNWGLDIDLAIWAIVDLAGGVEDGFLNGAMLSQNTPNPATGNTVITYALENKTDNVSVIIVDALGRIVATYNEGNKAAGKYTINVETSNLDAGVYYYALSAGKGRIAQKMVVSK